MPLRRAGDTHNWDGDAVFFPMTDGKTRIVCHVSREALEDRASADGRGEILGNPEEVFLTHRQRIEQIATLVLAVWNEAPNFIPR